LVFLLESDGMVKLPFVRTIKKKHKDIARDLVIAGFPTACYLRGTDNMYKRLWKECDKLLNDEIDYKTYKYWQDKVLGKYFGKNVKGELVGEAVYLKEWLIDFVPRLQAQVVTDKDKENLRKRFVPFMEETKKNELGILLQMKGLLPKEEFPDEDEEFGEVKK